MPTKIKPIYIKAVDQKSFSNLEKEILDIKSSISSTNKTTEDVVKGFNESKQRTDDTIDGISKTVEAVKKDVETVKADVRSIIINVDTVKEVVDARDGYDSLNSRLNHIEGLDIFRNGINLSTERIYEYDNEGYIIKEKVAGDLNYEIEYEYFNDKNIKLERHYHNNNLIGTKEYIYNSEGFITKVVSNNADILELLTPKGAQNDVENRLDVLEKLNIEVELDFIKRSILIGEYDGKAIFDKVNDMNERIQIIEDLMPDKIYDVLKLPDLLERLANIEYVLSHNSIVFSFEYEAGKDTYTLPKPVSSGKVKAYVEGITLIEGANEDFIIENKEYIKILVPVIDKCKITCEYY